jgi:hypothetical protein
MTMKTQHPKPSVLLLVTTIAVTARFAVAAATVFSDDDWNPQATVTAAASASSTYSNHYTAHQDVSWAVLSKQLNNSIKQDEYDAFMNGCRVSAGGQMQREYFCNKEEAYRLRRNAEQTQSVC